MSAATSTILAWLTRYSGFPSRRLPAGAELLLLFAAAAEADERAFPVNGGGIMRKDNAQFASQKQLSENRRHTHFKSDNRTAV